MKTLLVDKSNAGKRVDEILFSTGEFLSRSKASEVAKSGLVKVNGKPVKPGVKLKEGDLVEFEVKVEKESGIIKEDIPLDIVYEDDYLLVINKPAGLVVHPGNGHHDGTMLNGILFRYSDIDDSIDPSRPGIVHRIDKDTSGLVAVAKTKEAMLGLQAQLADHSMHREYVALVSGIIKEDEGKIIAPLARDKNDRVKFAVDLDGKEAITFFKVLKRFPRSNCTLVECRLLTGRTHQIRVHMEYIGHPIVGDLVYGKGNRVLYSNGQLLHAKSLSFVHPIVNQPMEFHCDLPEHFKNVLGSIS